MSQFTVGSVGGGGGGSVMSFSFTDGNGFDGTVTNPTTNPNLSLATTVANFNVIYANAGALVGTGVGTAGQVLTSNGAGLAPTWQDNAGGAQYTNVTNAMSPYTVTATDYFLSVDSSGGPVTINLPNSPSASREFIIKDRTGSAATNSITVKSLGGVTTVDLQSSYVFVDNFESLECLYHGGNYEIF